MANCLNVLYGFSSEKIQESITREIVLNGFEVKSVKMTTKNLIADYVKNHPEIDVIILKEYLDGGGKYSPIELTKLVDDVRNVNVVIVLSEKYRGKDAMRELYSAGILNAFFSDGKFGANPDKIAALACKGRTRREARVYYKINETIPDYINLSFEEFTDNYRYLIDDRQGISLIDRFVQISHMLYPGQLGAFIDKLPNTVKSLLLNYSEFYDIANDVYRRGYSREYYKKPKGIKKGITKEQIQEALLKKEEVKKSTKEPMLVAVDSSTTVIDESNNTDYSPTSDEEINVNEEKIEQTKPKKGLFKWRTKKKAKASGADEEENIFSIFEQESDFNLEGIDLEPIENEGLADYKYRENNEEDMVAESYRVEQEQKEEAVENEHPIKETKRSEADNKLQIVRHDKKSESIQVADDDLDNLSIEELKRMLEA